MKKLLMACWILAFACAALFYPISWMLAAGATEAWRITPHDAATVQSRKALFELDAPDKNSPDYPTKVMELYGMPTQQPIKYLFVAEERFIHPPEKPDLTLLPVDPAKKEYPLELDMIRYLTPWFTGGATVTGLIFLGIWAWLRRRTAKSSAPQQA